MEFFQEIKELFIPNNTSYFSILPKELINLVVIHIHTSRDLSNFIKYISDHKSIIYKINGDSWKELFYLKFRETFITSFKFDNDDFKIMNKFYDGYNSNYPKWLEIEYPFNNIGRFIEFDTDIAYYLWLKCKEFSHFIIIKEAFLKAAILNHINPSELIGIYNYYITEFIDQRHILLQRYNIKSISQFDLKNLKKCEDMKLGHLLLLGFGKNTLSRYEPEDLLIYYEKFYFYWALKKRIHSPEEILDKIFLNDCLKLMMDRKYNGSFNIIINKYLNIHYNKSDKTFLIELNNSISKIDDTCNIIKEEQTKLIIKHII